MGLFGKKKKSEEESLEAPGAEEIPEEKPEEKKEERADSGGPSLGQISVQVEKLNASVEAFAEVRKSFG